ncbi:molybdate ABC transporter permease subunit [Acaryochloris sp. IP29b_bin.148]|uniref:molybdate ABC transporter permease subunit n=1 Tax=Acaryochloris sp. IP29b_bin.148 TaxID=2969218 RepID=UPI0026283B2A|nr:molybdate ABC transporter permease subunit [Acaryochloris sp. IP29b_bin.148]
MDLTPLWTSLKIAAISTSITFVLGVATAYTMHRYQGKGKALIEGLLLAPLVLPPTVLGFLLLFLLGANGPLGQLLTPLGLNPVFTWYAAVITATVVSFPLLYKTALGAFQQLDPDIQAAARTLGASEWTLFRRIVLPLAGPGLVAGTSLAFARALGEFGATLMLAGNIPGQTQTLPMAIYFAVEGGAFTDALFWCGVTLVLTLGSLMGINLWLARGCVCSSRPKRSRRQPGRKSRQQRLSHPPGAERGLSVDLQKQVAGFQLKIAFHTHDTTLGILGASGAGKSMILRCIAGIETPDAGRIVLNGRVLFDSDQGINVPSCDRNIGFLFQDYALFPHLSAEENIAFALSSGQSLVASTASSHLAALHLSDWAHHYPHELSGGQQQRVALARALASQPQLLLLDEPFSALDTHLRNQIEKFMVTRLSTYEGMTLWVTHNLEEAYRLCDPLMVVERGQRSTLRSKHQILAQPETVSIAQLTGCKNFSRIQRQGPGQVLALDWNCRLHIVEPLGSHPTQVGIRAHQIRFFDLEPPGERPINTFPGWLVMTRETPHRMTLYLKLQEPPTHADDYQLQAEVFKDKWRQLKEHPFPWSITLDPIRIMLLRESAESHS